MYILINLNKKSIKSKYNENSNLEFRKSKEKENATDY